MRLIFIISILLSFRLFADLDVVTSKKSPLNSATKDQLSKVYLKKRDNINGTKVVPLDSKNKKEQAEFYKKITNKNSAQIHAYWMKQIFLGKKRPPKRVDTTQLKEHLKDDKNIGYTSKSIDAKVLHEIK
jgi:23S rRNA pseudoU1915 N3-methylase RlmH